MKKLTSLLLLLSMIAGTVLFAIPVGAQEAYYPELEGITMYAMGDSYFGGSSLGKDVTWVNKLGNKYKMNYENYGIGGSTMSDYVLDKSPMVGRVKRMKKSDANIILLEGGRNDRSQLVPLGDRDSRDTKTFYGAINYMVDYFLEKYPSALIILVTAWKHSNNTSTGYSNVTYANVMKDIAEYRNDPRVICFYAADPELSGVDMDDRDFRIKYCIKPDDVSHLNDEGMNYVLPKIEKFIAEEYIKYLNYLNPPATTVEETTAAPETTAEVTTAEETVDCGMPDNTTTEPVSEKGCGGFISFTSLSVLICGACIVLFKKKKIW
ncbi:MAG: SGNH/GDSL hydrolase family protein [Clostridia bacterium]|nr:SGNH/GDSL hydrolase family protein [Clostridia bacterium]